MKKNSTMTSRRSFLKKACLSGACLCGFSSLLKGETLSDIAQLTHEQQEESDPMPLQWIGNLLSNVEESGLTEEQKRQVIKSASFAHYQSLDMDKMLEPYIGKLDEFLSFLETKWGWKCTYSDDRKTLLIDEGKPYCVCPLMKNEKERKLPALCYCSEGFEERMFSVVCNHPVKASVAASIQRGDEKCVYRIDL